MGRGALSFDVPISLAVEAIFNDHTASPGLRLIVTKGGRVWSSRSTEASSATPRVQDAPALGICAVKVTG